MSKTRLAIMEKAAEELVRAAAKVSEAAKNETVLRHELEKELERLCERMNIQYTAYNLDLAVRGTRVNPKFADVVHGAIVIEYEPPRSFKKAEGANFAHARGQAEEYTLLLQHEEGRDLAEYVMYVWDGESIASGRYDGGKAHWEPLQQFGPEAAFVLLRSLEQQGRPLVHPRLLHDLVGPDAEIGHALVPILFDAVISAARSARTNRTKLLFTEWSRLFGQVVGVQTDRLQNLLKRHAKVHDRPYDKHVAEYLFALNTYIALVAKIVAALALPGKEGQRITNAAVPIEVRLEALESGAIFRSVGITNMLTGDFFAWYIDDAHRTKILKHISALSTILATISFDVSRKSPESTRDLFKGLYEQFVPREVRHALGEVYTPDWMAEYALDEVGWKAEDDLLDPTCGTGTFLLEAIKRRLVKNHRTGKVPIEELLRGIYGMDLNPLAVIASRASLVVYLSRFLDIKSPLSLPVYLADAINSAAHHRGVYRHRLQTEVGVLQIDIPREIVEHRNFHDALLRMRELIEANVSPTKIVEALEREFGLPHAAGDGGKAFAASVAAIAVLHKRDWNGIWCAILADRFAAGAIRPVSHVCGNPPWVKWSNLPPAYAEFIKEPCAKRGVFSEDAWVGGIESDISTVITYEAIAKWMRPKSRLAFFITATVFANESSQGFRRFYLPDINVHCRVISVDDFKELAPFEGVTNHPSLLIIERDAKTAFPIPYRVWHRSGKGDGNRVDIEQLLASPVPGSDAGPWIKGTKAQHVRWRRIFDASAKPNYIARKGVTTDANGIFFVRTIERLAADHVKIHNDPNLGRNDSIPEVTSSIELEHLFPMLRGRDVAAFRATPSNDHAILVPQRGMHGDPDLPRTAKHTYAFLHRFERVLAARSSYRRFQKGKPFWSLWSTGAYTFAPYKVFWKEMSGNQFVAAYLGEYRHPVLGRKIVVPDHKLYFIPVATEDEAAFLVGILNSPTVASGVNAYGAQLSLGVSVAEYLRIPKYDPRSKAHREISEMAQSLTKKGKTPSAADLSELDRLVLAVFDD